MNSNDKSKLKVLIKMILIQQSPKYMTSSQICDIINKYNWGFKTNITSNKIGKLLHSELRKSDYNFMSDIKSRKGKNKLMEYCI